jgi:hypothetical protein
MTLQLERQAIEAYMRANWTATPLGLDGHAFTPVNNSVLLTIKSGAAMQGSIGRTDNVIHNIGVLTCTIYTEGGKGSAKWRGYAEALQGLLQGVSLTSAGVVDTTGNVFVRFSPPQLSPNEHPYIGADFADPPFHITNLIAPYVRYSTR